MLSSGPQPGLHGIRSFQHRAGVNVRLEMNGPSAGCPDGILQLGQLFPDDLVVIHCPGIAGDAPAARL